MYPFPVFKTAVSADSRKILWLSALVLVESVFLVVALSWLLRFFPSKPVLAVLPEWQMLISPEKEMGVYRFFVFSALVLQAVAVFGLGKIFKEERDLKFFLAVECLLLSLMLSALFKIVIYADRPVLAGYAFQVLLVLSVLNKIFFAQIKSFLEGLWHLILRERNEKALKRIADVLFVVLMFAVLYIPDREAALAKNFMGEQFHHFDSFITAPAWAYKSGNLLNIDQISQYGLGMPMLIAELTRLFGGFTYYGIVSVFMWGSIVYYLLWYLLLRLWLKSVPIAILGLLTAIRIQMFHTGVHPYIYSLPSATIMRYCFDVLFMFFIWFHLKDPRPRHLIWAGITAGFASFYMVSTGAYLIVALYAYLFFYLIIPKIRPVVFSSWKDLISLGIYGAAPILTTVALGWTTHRQYFFHPDLLKNMNQFLQYMLSGAGNMPMFGSLIDGNFLASFIGFLLPVVLTLSIIFIISLMFLGKAKREDLFVVVLSIYGLGINHYYVMLSAITTYYTTGLPFIFVLTYWIKKFLDYQSREKYLKISLALIVVSLYALFTNHNHIGFPNMVNWSKNPITDRLVAQRLPDGRPYFNHLYHYNEAYKLPKNSLGSQDEELLYEESFPSDEELKLYFRQTFSFEEDARLIQSLTSAIQKVPLIAGFDSKILMDANRRPFFYHFPLVVSRPLKFRMYGVATMYSQEYFKQTIDQLETEKPPYVFMEKIYLQYKNVPQPKYYYYYYGDLMGLLEYVDRHYAPFKEGKYLVAMKRK